MTILGNNHGSEQVSKKGKSSKRDNKPRTGDAPFHKLMSNQLRQLYEMKLLDAPAYILFIVQCHGAPGWRWTFRVKDFCKEWGISKTAFYRAVSKLRDLGLLHWEVGDTITVWHGTDIARENSPAAGTDTFRSPENSPAAGTEIPAAGTEIPAVGTEIPAVGTAFPLAGQQTAETFVKAEPQKPTDFIQSNKIYSEQAEQSAAAFKNFSAEEEPKTDPATQVGATEEEANNDDGIDQAADEYICSPEPTSNPEAIEIAIALRDVGLLNPELKAEALKHQLADVQAALRLYQQRSQQKPIDNPQGWLTRCLQNRWWTENKQTTATATSHYPLELVEWYEKACAAGIVDGRDLQYCPNNSTMGNVEHLQVVMLVPPEERRAHLSPFKFVLWRDAIAQFPL